MYTTLQADSLKPIVVRSADEINKANILTVTGKPKRTRSKSGCVFCRMRKKKCDEEKPTCGLCAARGIECVYTAYPLRKVSKDTMLSIHEECGEVSPENSEKESQILELNAIGGAERAQEVHLKLATALFDEYLFLSSTKCTSPSEIGLDGLSQDYSLVSADSAKLLDEKPFQPNILIEPVNPLRLVLDERGFQLVHFFHNEIIHRICISPRAVQNHFASTFTSVSYRDESVLRLLAAWGALFVDGPNSASLKSRMAEASLALTKSYSNRVLDDQDKFNLICFHLNAAGIGVCLGDTKDWIHHHRKCGELIRGFGSIKNFLAKMNYLNGAKWVISNLHYNDVMSSESLRNGPLLRAEEYGSPFKDENDYSYGVDPLQGCMHPIFIVLCEILQSYSILSSVRKSLDADIQNYANDPTFDMTIINSRRAQHYAETEKHAKRLMQRITSCKPRKNQECFIDPAELHFHHTLFEAFRNTCKLYVLMYIRDLPPRAPEVQEVLLQNFELLDILIECDLRAAVTKILLLCGLACYREIDRIELRNKFTRLQSYYKVFNVHNVRHIVEQVWLANPDGLLTVDWGETCEKMGWTVAAF